MCSWSLSLFTRKYITVLVMMRVRVRDSTISVDVLLHVQVECVTCFQSAATTLQSDPRGIRFVLLAWSRVRW
jgi:hypothetical protein